MAFQMKMPGAQSDDVQKSLKQIHSWLYQLNENLHYTFSHLDEENFTDAFLLSLNQGGDSGLAEKVNSLTEKSNNLEAQTSSLEEQVNALALRLSQLFPSAWSSLTLLNARAWSSAYTPQCCLRGECVYLRGGLALNDPLSAQSSVAVALLPAKMRPTVNVPLLLTSDSGILRLTAQSDGTLSLRNTSGTTLSAADFISLTCSFAL